MVSNALIFQHEQEVLKQLKTGPSHHFFGRHDEKGTVPLNKTEMFRKESLG